MDGDRSTSGRLLVATAGIAVLASGCGAERGARDDGGTVTSPVSVGSSISADGSGDVSESLGSDSVDDDDDDAADDDIVLDVGAQDGSASAEGSDASGCEKVDFLFVIDNSGSMGDEQIALISSFP